MNTDQRTCLLTETQETAERLNKLNGFMASDAFPKLDREDKDLLYSQQRVMSKYVQILGKRLGRAGQQFEHAKATTIDAVEHEKAQIQLRDARVALRDCKNRLESILETHPSFHIADAIERANSILGAQ